MSRPHSVIVSLKATAATDGAKFHCDHPDGGRTFQLGHTSEVIAYVYAENHQELAQLGVKLIECAEMWAAGK